MRGFLDRFVVVLYRLGVLQDRGQASAERNADGVLDLDALDAALDSDFDSEVVA